MPRQVSSLTLAEARNIIAAGEKKAAELGVPYNIAVVDACGGLIAHARMDGAWLGSIDISIHKAWTARAFDSLRARSMISADQERGLAHVSFTELLVTDDGSSPEAMVARAEAAVVTSRRLETAISALGQRERYVVQQRFFSKKPQTLAAIGRKLGVSREYVRQVVEKATKKLRGHLERDADDLAFGE